MKLIKKNLKKVVYILPVIIILELGILVVDKNRTDGNRLNQNMDSLLKNFPDSNTTQQQKDKFFTYVKNMAKPAYVLDLTNCKPNPPILLAKRVDMIKIRNNDDVARTISRGGIPYSLPPNQITKFKASIFGTTGVLGYRCLNDDGESMVVGILYIVE